MIIVNDIGLWLTNPNMTDIPFQPNRINPNQGKEVNKSSQQLEKKPMSVESAKALLEVENFLTKEGPKPSKSGNKLILLSIVVIILIFLIILSSFIGRGSQNGGSNGLGSQQSNPLNSVNNDVKYCSNPINAVTSC